MGGVVSKDMFGFGRRVVDEACSNTSLSKVRYVAVEKPKWKVFGKQELRPLHPVRNGKGGCPCGANALCKQTVTPKGVTIHYPQKKRFEKRYKPPKIDKSFLEDKDRQIPKVKIVRPKKFGVVPVKSTPIWRMDSLVNSTPFQKNLNKLRRRRRSQKPNPANADSSPGDTSDASKPE